MSYRWASSHPISASLILFNYWRLCISCVLQTTGHFIPGIGVVSKSACTIRNASLFGLTSLQVHCRKFELRCVVSFRSTPIDVKGFVASIDADWGGCKCARKWTSGNVFFINDGPVCWKSNRQFIMTLFSGESRHIALLSCGEDLTWIWRHVHEIINLFSCLTSFV